MGLIMLKPSEALHRLAKRYVWWHTQTLAHRHLDIFSRMLLDLGNWEGMQSLRQ